VRLYRLHAHEEGGRDLFVRGAAAREVGDPLLCGAQFSLGRAMDARALELEAGAFAPESRTELLEDRPRPLEGFARLRLALGAALDRAGREQRSCVLERLVVACVHCFRVADRGARARQVAQLREDQRATPERGGDPRRKVDASRASLEPLRELLCLGCAAEAEKRLDRIRGGAEGDSVAEWFAVGERDEGVEAVECGTEVAERELEKSQRRLCSSERVDVAFACERDAPKTDGAGYIDVPQVGRPTSVSATPRPPSQSASASSAYADARP
jgi:hypothetical protein